MSTVVDTTMYPHAVMCGQLTPEEYHKWNSQTIAMKSPMFPYGAYSERPIPESFYVDMGEVMKEIAEDGLDTSMFDNSPDIQEIRIRAGKGPDPPTSHGKGVKGVKGIPVRRGKGIKKPPVRRGKGIKKPPTHRGKSLKARKTAQAATRRKKLSSRRKSKDGDDKSLLTPKEVKSQLPDGIDIISISRWKNTVRSEIEDGVEDFDGLGKPKIRIFKRRTNTKGKGEFRVYSDGTLVFIFDEAPPGMDTERRVVLIGEPTEGGKVVSINNFANAYNIPCGNTGQKNGKEFFFSKNWRSNEDYLIYARIINDEEEDEDSSSGSGSNSSEDEDSF